MKKRHNVFHHLITIFYISIQKPVFVIIWIFVFMAGYLIFQTKRTPFDIVLGLPLMLVGGGFIVNVTVDLMLVIFSPTYNKGVCVLCGEKKAKTQNYQKNSG